MGGAFGGDAAMGGGAADDTGATDDDTGATDDDTGAPLMSSFACSPQPPLGAQRTTASLDKTTSGASLRPRRFTWLMPRATK